MFPSPRYRKQLSSRREVRRLAAALLLAATAFHAYAGEQEQIDFANGLFARGLFGEAAVEYQNYLGEFPEGPNRQSALYRLGESRVASADYEAAVRALDALLAETPPDDLRDRAALRRGVALYQSGKAEAAAEALAGVAQSAKTPGVRPEAQYYLGKVHFAANRHEAAVEALKALTGAEDAGAFGPYGHYQLGFVYLAMARDEDAAVEFAAVANTAEADAALRTECRFRAAEIYDKLGWFDVAAKTYEQLRSESPDSEYAQRAAYGLTWSSYHSGQYDKALTAAAEFEKMYPESELRPGLLYLRGNCLYQQKKFAEAAKLYEELAGKFAQSPFVARAGLKRAWALYELNDREQAAAALRTLLETTTDPQLVGQGSFLLGNLLLNGGDAAGALEAFAMAAGAEHEFTADSHYKRAECLALLKRNGEAAGAYNDFAVKYPEHALVGEARLKAGDQLYLSGDYAGAAGAFEALDAAGAKDENVLYRLALSRQNEGTEKAAGAWQRLLDSFPQSPHGAEALLRIGEFRLREGKDPVAALELYQKALDAAGDGPFKGQALRGLALARFETKDFEGAAELFARLIREFPDEPLNAAVYTWAGQHEAQRERWENAVSAFEALLSKYPDYEQAGAASFELASALDKAGRKAEAAKRFEALASGAGANGLGADALIRLAGLRESEGKGDEAIALYEKAANTNASETSARARFRLGEIYQERKDFTSAARHFMRIAVLYLDDKLTPESLLRAGQCFEQGGDVAQARSVYEELTKQHPESAQAGSARERLAQMKG